MTDGSLTHNDQLPLPDCEPVSVESIESRIQGLDAEQLREALIHETSHADRLSVVLLIEGRLRQLTEDAQPTTLRD